MLLVVSTCFFFSEGEREVQRRCASGFKRIVSRQCSFSPPSPPGAKPRCCRAESGCTHAAAKHDDGCGGQGDGVRPGSATDVHARLLRSLSQFEAGPVFAEAFFWVVLLSSSGFSAMSRFGFTQNVHHVNKLEPHAETGSIQVTSRHWDGTVQREVRFRGNIHDQQLGASGTARNVVREKTGHTRKGGGSWTNKLLLSWTRNGGGGEISMAEPVVVTCCAAPGKEMARKNAGHGEQEMSETQQD